MKIDLHTHILPETWPDLVERYGYPGFVRLVHHAPCRAKMMVGDREFREIADNCWSPARRIEECDRCGVTTQVLSTVPVMFSYWAKPADALDLSKMLNDHVAGVVAEHPTRFEASGRSRCRMPTWRYRNSRGASQRDRAADSACAACRSARMSTA